MHSRFINFIERKKYLFLSYINYSIKMINILKLIGSRVRRIVCSNFQIEYCMNCERIEGYFQIIRMKLHQ